MYETVLSQLMERFGWPVLGVRADTSRLQVSSRVGEALIRVEGFGEALLRGGDFGQSPKLCFIRFELGKPEGEPTRWGIIHHKEISAQVVGSPKGIVIATSLMLSDLTLLTDQYKLGSLFMLVKRLLHDGDRRSGHLDRDWPFEGLSQPVFGNDASSLKLSGGTLMATALAGAASAMVLGNLALLLFYPFSCVGLGGFLMFASGHVRKKEIFRAHRQARNATGTLATSRVFDACDEIRASMPMWFPVIGNDGGEQRLVDAVLQTARLDARSTVHDLQLRLKLHNIAWPSTTVESCQQVPSSWATVELYGPSATIVHVPARRYEERTPTRLRWQMGAEELEQGGLSQWLREVDDRFYGTKTGPYR